jgi:parallel beta-helix repeat protein
MTLFAPAFLSSHPAEAANTPKSSDMSCPAGAVNIAAGLSIQAYVDRSSPSTTFCIQPGLYRMQQISPKYRQVFIGLPGAVLNGAEIIANARPEGRYWVAATPLVLSRPFGSCLKSRPRCNNPVRFFLDDRPLEPVGSLEDLQTGTVFHNIQARKIYLFDDPKGHTLEMAQRRYAFFSNGAKDVVVRGFVVEKYATPAQQGAIFGDEDRHATGWIIENNEVRFNSGAGLATGDSAIVRRNRVHHNGQLGVSPNGTGVLIEDNEIYENNIYGFDAAWEGGGVKAGAVDDLTLRRNHVYDNHGSGLWCDVNCRNMLVEENIVDRNADAGIFYELSEGAVIRNNIARWNGTGSGGQQGSAWFWGAGIQIAASRNVQVYGNKVTVAQGGTGIILIDQARKRPGPSGALYQTVGNIVKNNEVIYEGKGGVSGGASDVPADNPNYGIIEKGRNHFDGNTYVQQQTKEPAKFIWGGDPISIEAFRSLGQEITGRIIH